MARTAALRIDNKVTDLAAVNTCFEDFADANDVPAKPRMHILVALDEVLTNVIKYAWRDDGAHECRVSFRRTADRVEIRVVDDGVPFDPMADRHRREPDRTARGVAIGGRGLKVVQALMNEVRYARSRGRNRLTLVKYLAPRGV